MHPKEQASTPRHSWRELTVYMREVHPAFHTIEDYHAALRFLISPYPKVGDILADWSKN